MSPHVMLLGALTRLSQAKNATVSDGVLQTYIDLLIDLPTDAVVGACATLAKMKTFGFPQVGEIREMVEGDRKGKALTAWAAVLKAAPVGGAYRAVEFQDPNMADALRIAAGSWDRLCSVDTSSFEFSKMRETFLEMYERYAATPKAGSIVMTGIHGSSRAPYVVPRIDAAPPAALPASAHELPPPDRREAADVMRRLTAQIHERRTAEPNIPKEQRK